mgnify:CR=1 FL=1
MQRPLIETEETLIIETPERVELSFALASIGNRFLAVMIDHAIQYTAAILLIVFFLTLSSQASPIDQIYDGTASEIPKWIIAVMLVVVYFWFAGYFIVFEWLMHGQTPGKRIMKLRVIREDGRPITLWEAAARNLLRLFDAIPPVVVPLYSVGLITIFLNKRDQRIGDVFAGTVVIRERIDEAPTFKEAFSTPISDSAFIRVQKQLTLTASVDKLTQREMEVVEIFLRRRWDLTDKQRLWMAWRVALPLMFKLKPKYDMKDFSYEGFLEEILHRFNARQRYLN